MFLFLVAKPLQIISVKEDRYTRAKT